MSPRFGFLACVLLALVVLHAGLGGLAFLFLFARIRSEALLDHPVRARLMSLVQERPGLGMGELAAEAGIGWGTTVHHMNRLEKAGLVNSQSAGRRRAFFPASLDAGARGVASLAHRPAAQRLAAAVLRTPGVSQQDAARLANVSPALAHRLLSELESRGLVRSQKTWRNRNYCATEWLQGQDQRSTMPTGRSSENSALSLQETNSI